MLLAAHVFMSLFASEFNELRFTDERMLAVGKLAARAVFFGNVDDYMELLDKGMAPDSAEMSRVQDCKIKVYGQTANQNQFGLVDDLTGHDDDVDPLNRYKLIKLDVVGGYYATLTFALTNRHSGAELWQMPLPMIITVSLKYSSDYRTAKYKGFTAKMLNPTYLPNAIREQISGDWGVISEMHSTCASGYYKAILNGEYDKKDTAQSSLKDKPIEAVLEEALAKANVHRDLVFKSFVDRPFQQFKSAVYDLRLLENLPPLLDEESNPAEKSKSN